MSLLEFMKADSDTPLNFISEFHTSDLNLFMLEFFTSNLILSNVENP